MPSWGSLLGAGSVAEQLLIWGVLQEVITSLLGPFFAEIQQKVNEANPVVPLTPADLADMVVRNYRTLQEAIGEAALSGVNADRMTLLVNDAGEAPGPVDLATLMLRGQIPADGTGPDATSFAQGVAESRLKDKWTQAVHDIAQEWPTTIDVVNAAIRSQLSSDEARSLFTQVRGRPEYFDLLVNVRGNPPTPTELIELVRRKFIPADGTGPDVLSMQQGIAEGDTKNKWYPALKELTRYVPPPRTVTAMVHSGSLTDEQAIALFSDAGLPADLQAAYLHNAHAERTTAVRGATARVVVELYETQAIGHDEAIHRLEAMGYTTADAELELQSADLAREMRYLDGAVTRVHALYVGHKITRQAVHNALAALGMSQGQIDHYLKIWDLEVAANVRQLTEAQIVEGWEYGVFDQTEAMTELVSIGYTPFDAWALISIKAKAKQPGRPERGPAGPGVLP